MVPEYSGFSLIVRRAMLLLRGPIYIFTAILVGIIGAAIVLLGTDISVALPPAFMFALPLIMVAVWKPRLGVLGLILLICFFEETPGGISGVERSARTMFYSVTVGLPAVYLPDLIILGILVLYLLKFVFHREPIPVQFDKIGAAILILFVSVLVSVLVSLGSYQTFGPPILPGNYGFFEGATLPEEIARLVAILQLKLYVIVFPSYLIGLFFFREKRDLDQAIFVFAIAMVATIFLALFRLVSNPAMVAAGTTVIVDTVSIWLMACALFYVISRWALGHYNYGQTTTRVICSFFFVLLILLSFRRTLWGAIALAFLFWPMILPQRAWGRLLFLIAIGVLATGAFFAFTPVGQVIIGSVVRRAGETSLSDGSTQYRFAMAVWFFQNLGDITAFGSALTPLWDQTVQLRRLEVTMEGVHSLYLWILMRFGIVGFLAMLVSGLLIFLRMREVYLFLQNEKGKILAGVAFLSFIIFIFNGILNPVYGQVRQMILLGIELALITRLPAIFAMQDTKKISVGSRTELEFETSRSSITAKKLAGMSKLQTF